MISRPAGSFAAAADSGCRISPTNPQRPALNAVECFRKDRLSVTRGVANSNFVMTVYSPRTRAGRPVASRKQRRIVSRGEQGLPYLLVSVDGRIADPRLIGDPVHLPGLAAIVGEGLLEVG